MDLPTTLIAMFNIKWNKMEIFLMFGSVPVRSRD